VAIGEQALGRSQDREITSDAVRDLAGFRTASEIRTKTGQRDSGDHATAPYGAPAVFPPGTYSLQRFASVPVIVDRGRAPFSPIGT